MRNASHRSICRLRRAARRVGGGIRRGWRAETLSRGAPAPLQSCASGSPLAWTPCQGTVSPSPGSTLASMGHRLLHPGVSTWFRGPWLLHTPSVHLSFSVHLLLVFLGCLLVSVCPSLSECLPFSFLFSLPAWIPFISLRPSCYLSACSLAFFFFFTSLTSSLL